MRPQSLIFTLYGDYVVYRASEIWVGSLVKLLAPFGLREEASRAALRRLVEAGWLQTRRCGKSSYYALTLKGSRLYSEGIPRIMERRSTNWDGQWRILTYCIPEQRRELRDTLRRELTWMGWGPLNNSIWLTPHDLSTEVKQLVQRLGIAGCVDLFTGSHEAFRDSGVLVARCWNLPALSESYARFLAKFEPRLKQHKTQVAAGEPVDPMQCYVARITLIHDYRKFPFVDPQLPTSLQPAGWPGDRAHAVFREYHALLWHPAYRFFDLVISEEPAAIAGAAGSQAAPPSEEFRSFAWRWGPERLTHALVSAASTD